MYFVFCFAINSLTAQRTDTISESTAVVFQDTIPVALDSMTVNDVIDSLEASSLVVQKDTFTIIGVGDMMLGTNFPATSYLPPNGGKDQLRAVAHILKDADVTFGNLEGTVFDGEGMVKKCKDPSVCYAFRSPASYAQHFADTGFDLLSLANNHSGDFGLKGRNGTKAALDSVGIAYAGLLGTDEYVIIEKDSLKFGFCAFSPNTGTCSIHDLARATELVQTLAQMSDVVIVSFHGGAEKDKHQHVPKAKETYYGENRGDVHEFAHTVIDAGADIVFGHGPHVTRAAELYKDRFIIYSLGNFCTYGRFDLRTVMGYAPIIKLQIDRAGRFLGGESIPIYQGYQHGPKPDKRKRATAKLIELTKADFPDTPLVIEPNGKMYKKE